jgi:hypothetical protein
VEDVRGNLHLMRHAPRGVCEWKWYHGSNARLLYEDGLFYIPLGDAAPNKPKIMKEDYNK